jgi:hypothetical protein
VTATQLAKLKAKTDVSQIFLVYMATIGDVNKTAAALDLDPVFVDALAREEGWKQKVRRISTMSKSEKPGDWERAQNRALNFVQAHRVRMVLERMIALFDGLDNEGVHKKLASYDRSGRPMLSARFFADITAAMDKVHNLSYQALGDSMGERKDRRDAGGDDVSATQLHAALINALNSPIAKDKVSEALVDEAATAIEENSKNEEVERNSAEAEVAASQAESVSADEISSIGDETPL